MPYVHIRLTAKERINREQKQTLIARTTDMLYEELGKKPSSTYVLIEELDTDNWGSGGKTVTEILDSRN